VFAPTSDTENSTDDEESSDNDSDPSANITGAVHLPLDSNCQLSSDDDDDNILYRLASDVESASDVFSSPQDSDEDTGGWTRNILQRTPVNFDSMPIVPKQPFFFSRGRSC